MRNAAAATFDDDFGFDKPARKAAPRKPRARPGKKKRSSFRLDMHKVARYAAVGMSATLALGIMVNALMLQKSRHPAPLFGKGVAIAPPPAPVAAPAARTPAPAAPPVEQAPAEVPAPAAKPHHAADKTSEGDAIARLLQGPGGGAPTVDKADSKTVLGVQRALAKLGFAVKPDGTLGLSTRKAIEAFEKDRHLPINGEISHRLVRTIGAESGMKID